MDRIEDNGDRFRTHRFTCEQVSILVCVRGTQTNEWRREKLWRNSVTCCRPNSESRNEKTKQKPNMQIQSLNSLAELINIQACFDRSIESRCDFSWYIYCISVCSGKSGKSPRNMNPFPIYGALIVPN